MAGWWHAGWWHEGWWQPEWWTVDAPPPAPPQAERCVSLDVTGEERTVALDVSGEERSVALAVALERAVALGVNAEGGCE